MAALNPELVMTLRVAAAPMIARDVRQFDLAAADGASLPPFSAGAHVLVQAPNTATRRYSLCNAPAQLQHYSIAVKREAHGRGGSISMVDDLAPGDLLHVSLPRNEFALKDDAAAYVFIAGGIGITPIRSMVQHLATTSTAPWKLYYLTRESDLTPYRDEFSDPQHRGKVIVHHDLGDLEKAFDLWPVLEKPKGTQLYCCGPQGLMDAVRDMTGHWPSSAVHFEDFGAGQNVHRAADTAFTVRVGLDGPPIDVGASVSILEALRAHGHRVPSSCESGTCGSCRMRLLAGDAEHRDFVLSDAERADHIMVCVSRARTPELVVAP